VTWHYDVATCVSGSCLITVVTMEGEMGVAKFLVNFFKNCGVGLWLVWLSKIALVPERYRGSKS